MNKIRYAIFFLIKPIIGHAWEVPFDPDPSLYVEENSRDVISTIFWIVKSMTLIVCVYLLLRASKQLAEDDYSSALVTIIGATIAGSAVYLSVSIN